MGGAALRRLGAPWRDYPSAAELSRLTPPSRDRVVDLVRGVSLVVVVFGHSFMAAVRFTGRGLVPSNTLAETPLLQLLTWVLQVMPLFFAAGAWANALSYRGATSYPVWLSGRVRRLLRPVLLYVAFWALATPLILLRDRDVTLPLLGITTQLLWFLGAYLLVTAMTPLFVRFSATPAKAILVWLAAATACDVVGLATGADWVRLLNFVLVWGLAGQTGLLVFSHRRPPPGQALRFAFVAFAFDVAFVALGPWPRSLVGMPDAPMSNMAPPSVALALHCVTLAMLVAAAYGGLTRLAQRERVWRPTCVVNAAAMTLYLWHIAAMMLAIITLQRLGLDLVGFSTDGWALPRFVFWSCFALYTVGLVWIARPWEHLHIPWWDGVPVHSATRSWPYRLRATIAVAGLMVVVVGILALSLTGLVGFPYNSSVSYHGVDVTSGLACAAALVGMALVRASGVGPPRSGESLAHPERSTLGSPAPD
ncbi:MAG: acyltransferase [Candidatus Nanopelagicales bacterium]